MFNFENDKEKKGDEIFFSFGYWIVLALAVLLPVLTLAGNGVPTLMTKVFIGGSFVFLALACFAIAYMRKQEIPLPPSLILVTAWGLPVAYILSSLFAPNGGTFFGERLLMDSPVFMLIIAIAMTITAVALNTTSRALGVYLAMLASAVVLTVSELYIFFQRYQNIQEGIANTSIQSLSLVGSLNDLGIFFGLITIFLLLSLVMLPVTILVRIILWLVLIASLYFLAVVNLTALWWIVGAFALAFLVYSASNVYFIQKKGGKSMLSIASLVVLLVAATFIFIPPSTKTGDITVTGQFADTLQVGEFDVRPSWKTTVSLGSQSFEDNGAVFGAGPGSFYHIWAQYLPDSINVSAFWLTDFFYGIGFVPTSIISTGLLGAIAWLLFFTIFLWRGTRSLLRFGEVVKGDIAGYIRVTSFVASLFLWITAVIMVPSPVLLIFAAIFTGIFIASLSFSAGAKGLLRIVFRSNPQVGFASALILTLAIILAGGGIFGLYTRYSAEMTYQNAVEVVANTGDIDRAYELVTDAIETHELDVYYRFKSNLDALRIQNLVAENRPPEEILEAFEGYLQNARTNGLEATKLDKRDYQNWSNLGSIYQSIVPLGVEGSIDSALTQYDNALEYRPNSPSIYYAKAVLERSRGNDEQARAYVQKAITLRNQYTDAIFLLSQIQIAANEVEQAINSVEAITLFNPNNAVAHFQLGLLHYSQEDFVEAVRSLERATNIDEDYANARYFLALSYWKLGDNAKALEHFRLVQETNPDNTELAKIIENLEAGDDPFAHLEEAPNIESRAGLPINDIGDGSEFNIDVSDLAE
jgi:tetratricopeptide (TPR) repeat protein